MNRSNEIEIMMLVAITIKPKFLEFESFVKEKSEFIVTKH